MSGVVDGEVFPVAQRHADNGKGCARIALAVDGVKDLFVRPAPVVVCPKHIGIPSTGDDAGAFLDARIAYARKQADTRRDVRAGLGSIARGKRSSQQRSEQQSFHLAPGHFGGGCVQVNKISLLNQIGEFISWQSGIFAAVTLQLFNDLTRRQPLP